MAVGASSLKCPNAFSPNGDGINDEWKVSYSGIVGFECSIFDRYGHKMISFSDPSQGWDGRHNGKNVPSGAYYYVIKARGADGKDYKLSGDINIVNYRK
ncbi:T9SS type B sorting domain-containing protein [uncultured Duncaniella sp.]|uniref:T9SS type B sorting domain-containing protein n=1 Tax=uncultured Duncaniella sp. TaxID=2768039 RepID=UPI00272F6C4F|nr:T9SS type B sorting domain-containing protein [uncultured Duncaniella sp.]